MSTFLQVAFWVQTLERAVKTAAQTALLVVGAEAVNVFTVDYVELAGLTAGGAALSVLTSLASARIGSDSPSLVD